MKAGDVVRKMMKNLCGDANPPRDMAGMHPCIHLWMNLDRDGNVCREKSGVRLRVQIYDSMAISK